jgi:hypothetical protein
MKAQGMTFAKGIILENRTFSKVKKLKIFDRATTTLMHYFLFWRRLF